MIVFIIFHIAVYLCRKETECFGNFYVNPQQFEHFPGRNSSVLILIELTNVTVLNCNLILFYNSNIFVDFCCCYIR